MVVWKKCLAVYFCFIASGNPCYMLAREDVLCNWYMIRYVLIKYRWRSNFILDGMRHRRLEQLTPLLSHLPRWLLPCCLPYYYLIQLFLHIVAVVSSTSPTYSLSSISSVQLPLLWFPDWLPLEFHWAVDLYWSSEMCKYLIEFLQLFNHIFYRIFMNILWSFYFIW